MIKSDICSHIAGVQILTVNATRHYASLNLIQQQLRGLVEEEFGEGNLQECMNLGSWEWNFQSDNIRCSGLSFLKE
jgi:hypothetical protein